MTLKHLRIFWTVCKYQSITVAAEHLNMLQPAVSVSIRELEAFYNVKLFERMNRRIYMTDSGAALLKYANRILADFEESVDVLRNTKMPVSLRVGANTTVSASILPDVLKVYAKKNPNIHLTSMVDDTAAIETQLLKNELDLAMIDNISASPHFVSRSIMQDEMIAVCSRRYMPVPEEPFSLKKLSREKLLLREKGSGTRECIDTVFASRGISISPTMESVSAHVLLAAARNGLGITILSRQFLEKDLKNKTLYEIPLPNVTFMRSYYLIYHKNKHVTDAMEQFFSAVEQITDTPAESD
ncbi:MAG: LysR family transcriptional regulator [Clostridia bacterium]|nr:LysR family transcriptional regulator [Clostridia bacterium]